MIVNHLSRLLGERRLNIRELQRATRDAHPKGEMSYSTLHDLYHGKSQMVRFDTLDTLCRILGVSVGDILEYRPDE